MPFSILRRDFLKTGTALAAGIATGEAWAATVEQATCSSPHAAAQGWLIGVAQYSFRHIGLYEMLDKMVTLGVQRVEPAFFLSLDASRPQLQVNEGLSATVRAELKQKLTDRGISMSSFYANLGTDSEQAKKVFAFCQEMGIESIVAEPPAEAFDMIEALCDQYEINLAVHNHPRSPNSAYWHPERVLAVCQGRGKRIGACCDTGHWVRSGLDPVQCLKQMEGRLLGFHLKDVAEAGKPESRDVPLGQGKANYTAVLAELKRQKYRGVMTVEYEHMSSALIDEVAQCIAFVEQSCE